MRKFVGLLSALHAPPLWVWVVGIASLTAAVWAYSENALP